MDTFITHFLTQISMSIGVIFLFGWLIALCNKAFYSNLGSLGTTACYVTGAIGTPVHECAHALFCIIFGHKITEMKLFQVGSNDGTLGYVSHSYNKKNIYHKIGNFFIGVAPIVVISAILYLLAYWLVPDMLKGITREISQIKRVDGLDDIPDIVENMIDICKAIFSKLDNPKWWIFILVGSFLALHMTLSGADIKGALSGLGFLLGAIAIADVILVLIGKRAISSFTGFFVTVGGYLLGFLTLALVISLIALGLSFILKATLLRKRL